MNEFQLPSHSRVLKGCSMMSGLLSFGSETEHTMCDDVSRAWSLLKGFACEVRELSLS
jgi:hypothetical protein